NTRRMCLRSWTRSYGSGSAHGEEVPFARDALQLVGATVLEVESGPGHKITDRTRREHLPGPGLILHPRADHGGDAAELPGDPLALAGVEPRADLDPQRTDRVASGEAAAHGARRAVEGCVEPVTSRVPLGTAVPLKVRANGDVVSLDDVAPTPIAEGGR